MVSKTLNHPYLENRVTRLYPGFIYTSCPFCLCFWASDPQFPEAEAEAKRDRDEHIARFHNSAK